MRFCCDSFSRNLRENLGACILNDDVVQSLNVKEKKSTIHLIAFSYAKITWNVIMCL